MRQIQRADCSSWHLHFYEFALILKVKHIALSLIHGEFGPRRTQGTSPGVCSFGESPRQFLRDIFECYLEADSITPPLSQPGQLQAGFLSYVTGYRHSHSKILDVEGSL
jgi:hypothetical protein